MATIVKDMVNHMWEPATNEKEILAWVASECPEQDSVSE
jgi:hypothetical protein